MGLVGLIDLTNLGIKIMRSQQRRLQGTRDQGLMKSFCIVHWLHEASLPEVVDNFLASSTSSRPSRVAGATCPHRSVVSPYRIGELP